MRLQPGKNINEVDTLAQLEAVIRCEWYMCIQSDSDTEIVAPMLRVSDAIQQKKVQ